MKSVLACIIPATKKIIDSLGELDFLTEISEGFDKIYDFYINNNNRTVGWYHNMYEYVYEEAEKIAAAIKTIVKRA